MGVAPAAGLADYRFVVVLVVCDAGLAQLALAGAGQLFPGRSHLFQLLPVRRRRSARHFPAFGGVLTVLMQLFHGKPLSPPADI